jgi:cytidyltransferase-like protein
VEGVVLVLAHGTFDLLHVGHVRFLERARALGDRLVVSVTPSICVRKGPGRPVFSDDERLEMLRALRCVSEAQLAFGATGVEAIARWRPAIYAKGVDYRGSADPALAEEREAARRHGGKLVIVCAGPKLSSSDILSGDFLRSRAHAH